MGYGIGELYPRVIDITDDEDASILAAELTIEVKLALALFRFANPRGHDGSAEDERLWQRARQEAHRLLPYLASSDADDAGRYLTATG
jgi:hypothetical protein